MVSSLRPRGSTTAWRRLRQWHQQFIPCPCGICGEPVRIGDRWQLDHRVPRAHGGGDLGNLQISHARCNSVKGATTRRAWRPAERPGFSGSGALETSRALSVSREKSADRDW
jgi:5-methylcytosine-specific restriction endonuclease McrA